ncbi:MAG: AAA family ATPase [Proteobacteria bacterium]|jgi:MoxR-like ATPase|nr:AAA family ATPase [Pseudomonadota bacterium]
MSYDASIEGMEQQVSSHSALLERASGEMSRRIVGQKDVVQRLIMALIAEGHVLLEGLPGLAKTTTVKTLAQTAALSFGRIQFTPDLLPADVIGTQIYDPRSGEFKVRKGPIFQNIVLADEINRAPAKVQSALLEAMQERQVTIGDQSFRLARPFLVLATQNPIEQEGTYPLPEAQVDRFLFKVNVTYGTLDEEQLVIARAMTGDEAPLTPVLTGESLLAMRDLSLKLHVADKVRRYIVQLVFATRDPAAYGLKDLVNLIHIGASPRASINLERAARVNALMQGRAFVTPQDIKDVGLDVLRHRVLPTYEAEAEGVKSEQIIKRIFDRVDVP